MTARQNFIWGGLAVLLFFGALGWARERDPFLRKWFTIQTANGGCIDCVAVLPKPARRLPVVVFAHESCGSIMNDGPYLRQMAELGLAAVSLEYNQTNKAMFDTEFGELLRYLYRQRWADTNSIAWVGLGLGADRLFGFVRSCPGQQPKLCVQINGSGVPQEGNDAGLANEFAMLRASFLVVHGEPDDQSPVGDTKRLVSMLQLNGATAELKLVPGLPSDLGLDRKLILRKVGEYSLMHLTGSGAWQDYHSISEWKSRATSLWFWWMPAAIWVCGWMLWLRRRAARRVARCPFSRSELALWGIAVLLAAWALAITGVHLITPLFRVQDATLKIARRFLVQPKEREDFEYLAPRPIWRNQRLNVLLEHSELAGYNRQLVNWRLDDTMFRDFVLSPVITGDSDEQPNWRRMLWEEFYPRVRHEQSLESSAGIVVRHLCERVTVASMPNLSHDIAAIWTRQITDRSDFECLYVAALRSVGIPARLDSRRQAEFWNGSRWAPAPAPAIMSL
jgi:hypothetical protein